MSGSFNRARQISGEDFSFHMALVNALFCCVSAGGGKLIGRYGKVMKYQNLLPLPGIAAGTKALDMGS